MNLAIISGRLGANPEVKYLPSGNAVCELRVASTEFYSKDGEKHERTEWHRCKVWGKQAENAGKYLVKGQAVTLQGRIQTRSWEKHDGTKGYVTEIVVENLEYGAKPREHGDDEQPQRQQGGGQATQRQRTAPATTQRQNGNGQAAPTQAQPQQQAQRPAQGYSAPDDDFAPSMDDDIPF